LSQQAQVAAAEKFKAPEVSIPGEAGGSTTVCNAFNMLAVLQITHVKMNIQ
jgi:hypothetical protein